MEELNIPEDKCNDHRNYDFNDCVMKSLSEQVGWIRSFSIFPDFFNLSLFLLIPGWVQDQVGCMEWERYGSDPFVRKCDESTVS